MSRKLVFTALGIFLLSIVAFAQAPTHWRGPNANGVYNDTGLLKSWPEDGPEILWHFDGVGEGFSSPAFANNAIYLSGMEDSTGYIYSLSQDGELIWKKEYGKEWSVSFPGSRSTPVIVGDLLYIYSGLGVVYCMDAGNGDLKWKKDLMKELGGRNIQWGVTETFLIDGDKLFCTPGGEIHNVVALNRYNGELIWTSKGEGEKSAYCSPLLIELPARKLLVTMTEKHILGIDAETGSKLWSYGQSNTWSVHANTPVYSDGALFCFSGYGQGGVKLKLSPDGSSVSKMWVSKTLDSRIGGIVLVDGYLYGSGDTNRYWQCVDWETGEQKYKAKDIGKGVVISADGMLFLYSDRGELALVKATPEEFKVSGKTKVKLGNMQHWAHPAINNGRLFVRHGNALIAYKIK
ncbi:MAG: PQQ-binding-like beta-propeller repeat protein [Chlorobi bacterium]|nr:PQQ-binding-like beta-propeller repeat protein [Chlorobiota bacterium]